VLKKTSFLACFKVRFHYLPSETEEINTNLRHHVLSSSQDSNVKHPSFEGISNAKHLIDVVHK